LVAQLVVLALFIVLTIFAVKRFRSDTWSPQREDEINEAARDGKYVAEYRFSVSWRTIRSQEQSTGRRGYVGEMASSKARTQFLC
jgi:hypothetical protein